MVDLTNLATVVGTDNVSPVYNPNSRWQIWNLNEIYIGGVGTKKFIPKVGDEVHEILGNVITTYVVVGINEETLVAIMQQSDISRVTQDLSGDDVLFGVGPGTQSDTYRAYIDKSVFPYRLSVDARLRVGGTNSSVAKVFRGTDTSNDGVVISGVFNQNGQLLSENIPLELAAITGNRSLKVVSPCHTTFSLENGEVVTAVLYHALGFVISKRQLLVENTGFIRATNASAKYVVGISLETPFLSTTQNTVILYPLNVPLNAINLIGVVNYSDGSAVRLAVDGTRFAVEGLEAFVATTIGYTSDIVLKYRLAAGETGIGIYSGAQDHISQTYQIVTANSNGSYAVKIYGYPVWINSISGYRMQWFLYDLDRSVKYDVTSNVVINTSRTPFNPTLYGVKQTLSISLNLKDVNGNYNSFVHVQFTDVTLNKQGIGRPDLDGIANWNVQTISGQTPAYGNGVYATFIRVATDLWKVKLDCNAVNLPAWLTKVFNTTNPLFNPYAELQAPQPTHFRLKAGGNDVEYPIADWNGDLMLNQTLTNNSTVFVKFLKRTTETDLELSVSGFSLFQVNSSGAFV